MPHQDWIETLAKVVGGSALGGVVVALIQGRLKPSAPSEMVDAATKAAKDMLGEMRGEIARLSARVDALEDENVQCRGENRQLWTHIGGLEKLLRDEGIPIPARDLPGTFVVLESDRATVFKPEKGQP